MVKAAALAEAAAVVVVVVFRAVIITSLGRGGGGSGIGSGCKDKIKGQGLWAGSFQPAGCHYLQITQVTSQFKFVIFTWISVRKL